jgi:hypothetical protein
MPAFYALTGAACANCGVENPSGARSELGTSPLPVKLAFVEALECAFELGDTDELEQLLGIIEGFRSANASRGSTGTPAHFRAKLAGDAPAAERDFRRAADIFRERELVFWLAVTQLEQAEWLTGRERSDEAQPLLLQARETSSNSKRNRGSSESTRSELPPWTRSPPN